MGSLDTVRCQDDDEYRHHVTLNRSFEIQSTEVTQGMFESVMNYNPSYFGPNGAGVECGNDCPVEMVSWHEAAAYCNRLSRLAGLSLCYVCTGIGGGVTCDVAQGYDGTVTRPNIYMCPGYRLPTDAEWEYAYRAGTQTVYYSGDHDPKACECPGEDVNLNAIGWYCGNAGPTTHPVGLKQKNAWHLYDMAGNVWEWCHDWYTRNLGPDPVIDPCGPKSGNERVLRGGSWTYHAHGLRAGNRHYDVGLGSEYWNEYGFRPVRSLVP